MPGELKLPQATQVLLVVSVCNALQALITSLFVCLFAVLIIIIFNIFHTACPENACQLVGAGEEDPNQCPSVYHLSDFPAGPNRQRYPAVV